MEEHAAPLGFGRMNPYRYERNVFNLAHKLRRLRRSDGADLP